MQALLTTLVLPPVGLLLLALLSLGLRRRWLSATFLALALLLATPAVVRALTQAYTRLPPQTEVLRQAQAWQGRADAVVLVLGAGIRQGARADGGWDLKPRTAERLRRGLWWSRQLRLPLAFSGGVSSQGDVDAPAEAHVVRDTLAEMQAPAAIWLEAESVDTRGNARHAVKLLRQHGQKNVLVVTDALHMPRVLAHLRREAPDLRFLPAPLTQAAGRPLRALDWLPAQRGLEESHYLAYEIAARIAGH